MMTINYKTGVCFCLSKVSFFLELLWCRGHFVDRAPSCQLLLRNGLGEGEKTQNQEELAEAVGVAWRFQPALQ